MILDLEILTKTDNHLGKQYCQGGSIYSPAKLVDILKKT